MRSNLGVRWMIRMDMAAVLEIERQDEIEPWDDKEFRRILSLRNCIGMVCELDGNIVGFMVYLVLPQYIEVLRMSVATNRTRGKIGTAMVDKLKAKLSPLRRPLIRIRVAETNTAAALFLRTQGFLATLEAGAFGDRDGYRFEYSVAEPSKIANFRMNAI